MLTLSTLGATSIPMRNNNKKKYHHGRLRSELLKTAAEIISTDGPDNLSIRTLSRRIGVSRTALYRHFPNKTALLAAIGEDGFIRLTSNYRRINSDDSLDASTRLQMIGRAYVDFALKNPGHYRLMFGHEIMKEQRPAELGAAARETFEEFLSVVEEVRREAGANPEETLSMAGVAWSMVHGLSSLLIDGQIEMISEFSALPALLGDVQKQRVDDVLDYDGFITKALNELGKIMSF
jgi:AcrR family transcriptional regulator